MDTRFVAFTYHKDHHEAIIAVKLDEKVIAAAIAGEKEPSMDRRPCCCTNAFYKQDKNQLIVTCHKCMTTQYISNDELKKGYRIGGEP